METDELFTSQFVVKVVNGIRQETYCAYRAFPVLLPLTLVYLLSFSFSPVVKRIELTCLKEEKIVKCRSEYRSHILISFQD